MSDYETFDPNSENVINREVIEHKPVTDERSHARRISLQALYEIDAVNHQVGDVLNYHTEETVNNDDIQALIRLLVTGIATNRDVIDYVLQEYAQEWPIDQVAIIDRNVLRIALYELGVQVDTPIGVAIDEAVELAKVYGADGSPRFVNGVLGAIANNLDKIREYMKEELDTE